LQSMETDLVRWLTSDWFRLLDGPKKKNNESRQAVLADWQRVQVLFCEVFNGDGADRKPLNLGESRTVKCTPESLLKQAAGCVASAVAMSQGVVENAGTFFETVIKMLSPHQVEMFAKSCRRAIEREVVSGIKAVGGLVGGLPCKTTFALLGIPDTITERQHAAMAEFNAFFPSPVMADSCIRQREEREREQERERQRERDQRYIEYLRSH